QRQGERGPGDDERRHEEPRAGETPLRHRSKTQTRMTSDVSSTSRAKSVATSLANIAVHEEADVEAVERDELEEIPYGTTSPTIARPR
ncbi:MAG TPA: hypothetical protein VLB67_09780, partial [Acidimicrobiia bacterium]|nr:hypothetical protein [Acidimicrobiia bacterium]